MTSFKNTTFLLFFICFTASFQLSPSFFCCGDDTTVDTRPKTAKEENNSKFSVAAAIAKNQQNYQRIVSFEAMNSQSQNSKNLSNKNKGSNKSDLATAMIQHQENMKRTTEHQKKSSQDYILNSQNSITQSNKTTSSNDVQTNIQQNSASKDLPDTDAHFFSSADHVATEHITMQQNQHIPNATNESNDQQSIENISSQVNYTNQNNNNSAPEITGNYINSEMSELILPSPAIPFRDISLDSPLEDNDDWPKYNNFGQVGVIKLQTAKGNQSPNQAFKGRILSSKELPSPIRSPQESTDSVNNNLPHMPEQDSNDDNQN